MTSSSNSAFLDKCLEFAKHLTTMKTGTASIDVNLGNDRFYFSVDKPLDKHSRSPSQFQHERFRPKKKSPSDLRRNSRRLKEFLEKKDKNMKGTQTPTNKSSPPVPQNSMETGDLSVISETPMAEDDENDSNIKVTRNSEKCEQIPENKVTTDSRSSALVQPLSPIKSPPKEKQKKIPETEEIRFIFCGPDHRTIEKSLPDFKYILQVEENKKHFMFSSLFPSSCIYKLKKNIKKFVKLPKNILIVSFYITKENKAYEPDQEEHRCPGQK